MPAFGLALRLWPPRAGYSVPAFRCRLFGADLSVPTARSPHATKGGILRGPASVVSEESWGASGHLRTLQALFCFCSCERILRTWAPLMRTLTREVAVWAGCPPCHQWGLAAHERVKGASRRARLPGTRHNKLARHGLSSDVETNNTTARPQQGTAETAITFAPTNCTKTAHFSPAKAMAVSNPHRHQRAKATTVSHHRATWPTGPGRGTCGP